MINVVTKRGYLFAFLANNIARRNFHATGVTSTRYHKPIPKKVMNVNTAWRYRQYNQIGIQPQPYDYFLVLDFEATCEENRQIEPQEIIEFPCLQVDSKTFNIVNKFHDYVRPEVNPNLSYFCIQLTGIIQEMVDDRPVFKDVLSSFLEWLSTNNLRPCGDNANSIFVTSGDWDLKTMLPMQCQFLNEPVPEEMHDWINLKSMFHKSTGYFPRGIKDMLAQLELRHEGKLHSGIDDCRNIVKIMKGLAERGLIFERTSHLLEKQKN